MPTTAQSRKAALDSDYAPLYAVAGLADVALETIKITITRQIADARTRQADLTDRAKALPEQLRSLPEVAKTQLAQAQKQAGVTYADFAGRGKVRLDEAVLTAKKLQAQAVSHATKVADDVAEAAVEATEAATDAATDAADQAKETTTAARTTAGRKAGGATTAAKKATTTRKPAPRKVPAKKVAAK